MLRENNGINVFTIKYWKKKAVIFCLIKQFNCLFLIGKNKETKISLAKWYMEKFNSYNAKLTLRNFFSVMESMKYFPNEWGKNASISWKTWTENSTLTQAGLIWMTDALLVFYKSSSDHPKYEWFYYSLFHQ